MTCDKAPGRAVPKHGVGGAGDVEARVRVRPFCGGPRPVRLYFSGGGAGAGDGGRNAARRLNADYVADHRGKMPRVHKRVYI